LQGWFVREHQAEILWRFIPEFLGSSLSRGGLLSDIAPLKGV
jgi:hypothetical protein